MGHDVTVYTNGDSKVRCRVKWIYPHSEWPLDDPMRPGLKNVDHTAWAMADAAEWADVIHLNDIVGVPFTRFVSTPTVLTIHHPDEPALSEQYARYPDVHYVAIAQWLAELSGLPIYEGGKKAGEAIIKENGSRSIIASLKSHGRGRDRLQFSFCHQLVAQMFASSKIGEHGTHVREKGEVFGQVREEHRVPRRRPDVKHDRRCPGG